MKTSKLWRGILAAAGTLLFAAGAAAQSTSVTITPLGGADVIWGSLPAPQLRVQLTVATACPTAVANTVTLRDNGVAFDTVSVPLSCGAGVQSGTIDVSYDSRRRFGSHYLSAHYPGGAAADIAFGFTFIALREEFRFVIGTSVLAALAASPSNCPVRTAELHLREELGVEPPPPYLRTPYEHVTFSTSSCTQPVAPARHSQWARIEVGLPLPTGSEVWVNDYLLFDDVRQWRRATATFDSHGATFEIFGRRVSGNAEPFIFATAAIAIPQPKSRDLDLQDLWWGGDAQSGWGLNVAKTDERIFASLFIYESDGRPLWVVMPGGTWDPVHEVYWGELFIPSGSFHGSYDSKAFSMGPAVGTGSLSFPSLDAGRFDYVIRGTAGGKDISRFVFGARQLGEIPAHAGIWWGGTGQDGWGVSIQQQGQDLFVSWYTYGADGKPMWYFSGGRASSSSTFAADLYRTTGAAWLGTRYSAASTRTFRVGTMSLTFQGVNATMTTTVDGLTQTRPLVRFPF